MTPLERAARAICVASGYDPDKDDQVANVGPLNWELFADQARAVLQAIREPSGGMIDEGYASYDANGGSLRDVFMDMIDAALEEG